MSLHLCLTQAPESDDPAALGSLGIYTQVLSPSLWCAFSVTSLCRPACMAWMRIRIDWAGLAVRTRNGRTARAGAQNTGPSGIDRCAALLGGSARARPGDCRVAAEAGVASG